MDITQKNAGALAVGIVACGLGFGLANESFRESVASKIGESELVRAPFLPTFPHAPYPLQVHLDQTLVNQIAAEAGGYENPENSPTFRERREANIQTLAKYLKDPRPEERFYALDVIANYGRGFKDLLPLVIDQLDSIEPKIVSRALEALGVLTTNDEASKNPLITAKINHLLSNSNDEVFFSALNYIALSPTALTPENQVHLRQTALTGKECSQRSEAVRALLASPESQIGLSQLLMEVALSDKELRSDVLYRLAERSDLQTKDMTMLGGVLVSANHFEIENILNIFQKAGAKASGQFEALNLTLLRNPNCYSDDAYRIGETASAIGAQEAAKDAWQKILRNPDARINQPRGFIKENLSSDRRRAALALMGTGVPLPDEDLQLMTKEIEAALITDWDTRHVLLWEAKDSHHPLLARLDRMALLGTALDTRANSIDQGQAIGILATHFDASPETQKMVIQGFYRIVERKCDLLNDPSSSFDRSDFSDDLNYVLGTLTKVSTDDLKNLGIHDGLARALKQMLDSGAGSRVEENIFKAIDKHFADSLAQDPQIVKSRSPSSWSGYGIGGWPSDSKAFNYQGDFESKIGDYWLPRLVRSERTSTAFSIFGALAGAGTLIGAAWTRSQLKSTPRKDDSPDEGISLSRAEDLGDEDGMGLA